MTTPAGQISLSDVNIDHQIINMNSINLLSIKDAIELYNTAIALETTL